MEEELGEAMVDGAAGSGFDVEEEDDERGDSGVCRRDEDRSGKRGNRPRNLGFRRPEDQSGEQQMGQEREKAISEAEDEADDPRDLGFHRPEEDQGDEHERGEVGTESGEEMDEQRDLGFRRPQDDQNKEYQLEQEQEEARKEPEDVDDPRDLGLRRQGREGDESGEDEADGHEDQIEEQKREQEREEGEAAANEEVLHLSFPPGRVRRIMKLDREIGKVHSEALFLVSLSAELFLELLAEKAGAVALANKKKNVRVDHLLSATRSHPHIADFLLDSISLPAKTLPEAKQTPNIPKPLPPGSRRIDEFFSKPS